MTHQTEENSVDPNQWHAVNSKCSGPKVTLHTGTTSLCLPCMLLSLGLAWFTQYIRTHTLAPTEYIMVFF